MKTNKRIISAAVLLLLYVTPVNASPVKEEPSPKVELKYAGSINNNPVFHLNINSTADERYQVSITDMNGVTLYTENVNKGNFNKNFLIDRNELGNDPVRVEIINRKNKSVVAYEINSDTRTLIENSVTKIL